MVGTMQFLGLQQTQDCWHIRQWVLILGCRWGTILTWMSGTVELDEVSFGKDLSYPRGSLVLGVLVGINTD